MPKYNYNQNIIAFNSTSIRRNTGYKITDIKYEFNYTLLSSSNRDRGSPQSPQMVTSGKVTIQIAGKS